MEELVITNPVTAMCIHWMGLYHSRKVAELLEKTFSQDDMVEAMVELAMALSLPQPTKHRDTERRPGAEAQAQALMFVIDDLETKNAVPKVSVDVKNFVVIQRAMTNTTLAVGDDALVRARLGSLEEGFTSLKQAINRMEGSLASRLSTVSSRPSPSELGYSSMSSSTTTTPSVTPSKLTSMSTGPSSFAEILSQGNTVIEQLEVPGRPGGSKPVTIQRSQNRSRSPSIKRNVEGENKVADDDKYKLVEKKKKKPKMTMGSSNVALQNVVPSGMGGRAEYYVAGTSPDIDVDTMKVVLKMCSEDYIKRKNENTENASNLVLSNENVTAIDLTPDYLENPRSRSWKISVPYSFKIMLDDNDFFPKSWSYRKFYPPRRTTDINKKARNELSQGSTNNSHQNGGLQ